MSTVIDARNTVMLLGYLMNNMNHDLIKQKIQSLVPEIMEIKFGCWIKLKSENSEHRINQDRGENMIWFGIEDSEDAYNPDEVEILGRPIQFADVLRAVNMTKGSKRISVQDCGTFMWYGFYESGESEDWNEIWDGEKRMTWNLSESFDGQSDETKSFVGELLGVKE